MAAVEYCLIFYQGHRKKIKTELSDSYKQQKERTHEDSSDSLSSLEKTSLFVSRRISLTPFE